MYILTEIRKMYKNYFIRVMICILLVVAVLDPICTYIECVSSNIFSNDIGTNAFQFWILMNSSGWGHAVFFMFFFVLPIVSTGFVFFYEQKGSLLEITINKVGRKKYFRAKLIVLFIITFINILSVLLINLAITYVIFDTESMTEQYFYCVPQQGTFAETLYGIEPFVMGIFYCILYALIQAILSLWALGIQMIGKFKKIYVAFAVPFVILYVLDYLFGILSARYEVDAYNPLIFVQPKAANALVEIITWKHIFITMGIMILCSMLLLFYGAKRNEDIL